MLTNKNLLWLSNRQKDLDKTIIKKHNLVENDDIFEKKIVAFFVELGEYANETRAFKFWSNKKSSAIDVCLEEYIDGVHFIISLGNYINYDFSEFNFNKKDVDEVRNYLDIINCLSDFEINRNNKSYEKLLNAFLNIIYINNYSNEQVIEMYKKKNAINYNRQDNNY